SMRRCRRAKRPRRSPRSFPPATRKPTSRAALKACWRGTIWPRGCARAAWLIPTADALSCAAGHSGGCLALAPALGGLAAGRGAAYGRRLLFRHSPVVRTVVPGRLHGGGRHGDREPAPERSRDLEGPDLSMKEPAPPREPAIRADHEHVERMSTWMGILLVVLAALLINQLQWVLLPFAIAGLLAYICTPAIEWLAKRTRLPRALFAVAAFLALLLSASLLAMLGVPSMIDGLRAMVTDLQGIVTDAVRGAIGSAKVTLMGEAMNAEEIAQAVMANVRAWLADAGRIAVLGTAAFATMIGAILTFVLLFYLLLSGPAVARGLL